ncbi:phosphoglycolate/pyridoxal phosphate family phosphatase [Candidatus Micrarchaeota archaeon]|nr:phosphoglycolate/pyridoxal phosphate family phosphatase [Candidatus Micrarchaeota archaeon]
MIKNFIFDLDGTLCIGKNVIPGGPEALERLRKDGAKILFFTNAATRSRESVAKKLRDMGYTANKKEIYTGAYILARYLKAHYHGKKIFMVGEIGMQEEFKNAGIRITNDEMEAEIVTVSLDREFTYEKLGKAHRAVSNGAILLASNKDHTHPTEKGHMPGSGAIVASIEFSTKQNAIVIGKPNEYAFEIIQKEEKIKNTETAMVGDRLDTDVLFAKNCGMTSVLVLTGSSTREDIPKKGTYERPRPEYVFESVIEIEKLVKKLKKK